MLPRTRKTRNPPPKILIPTIRCYAAHHGRKPSPNQVLANAANY
jgi:hypothetical protein